MSEKLVTYIRDKLEELDWSQNRLAREARLSSSEMSRVMNGKSPSLDICLSIADAVKVPPELILRLAGHLPKTKESVELQEWMGLADGLSSEQLREIMQVVKPLREQKLRVKGEKNRERT